MKNDNLKLLAPASDIDANTITFHTGDETEPIIKLCQNGDIFVKGKLVENDLEVVEGMRKFLENVKTYGGDK
jgi:hypothetical protein